MDVYSSSVPQEEGHSRAYPVYVQVATATPIPNAVPAPEDPRVFPAVVNVSVSPAQSNSPSVNTNGQYQGYNYNIPAGYTPQEKNILLNPDPQYFNPPNANPSQNMQSSNPQYFNPPNPSQNMQPSNPQYCPPANANPSEKKNVLLNPDSQYFNSSSHVVVSPYPQAQKPKGTPFHIYIDFDKKEDRSKNTAVGVGVGAAALVLTGGLLIPAIAGALAYNAMKKDCRSQYCVFPNSFVYELRSALSAELGVSPELILLRKKDQILDDNEHLEKYFKKSKKKAIVSATVMSSPVPGSNYYAPNGTFYPPSKTVTLLKARE